MGLKPKVFTDKGEPCFSAKYLKQWGEAGIMMKDWKDLSRPIKEMEAFLEHSDVDGRVHFLIRAGATISSRGASGFGEV